jgi:hypothetical protein
VYDEEDEEWRFESVKRGKDVCEREGVKICGYAKKLIMSGSEDTRYRKENVVVGKVCIPK